MTAGDAGPQLWYWQKAVPSFPLVFAPACLAITDVIAIVLPMAARTGACNLRHAGILSRCRPRPGCSRTPGHYLIYQNQASIVFVTLVLADMVTRKYRHGAAACRYFRVVVADVTANVATVTVVGVAGSAYGIA